MDHASKKSEKHICIGILAHVDAGKTTLSEAILYLTGSIRKLGRVDHQDAFLDNFALERERGITIFSKQAELMLGDRPVTLLDTPGHVDFSAEMERTLQILDCAVLVISGADGVQGHVETLWRLLGRYQIPTFLFINKMDQPGTDRAALMAELGKRLDSRCVDFGEAQETLYENLAMCDEEVLERYLEDGAISEGQIGRMIAARQVFPCFFGSALKLQGVEELLDGLNRYGGVREYPAAFGARVYKITRDTQGNRLTHMKITGGTLHVKDVLTNRRAEVGIQSEVAAGTQSVAGKASGMRLQETAGAGHTSGSVSGANTGANGSVGSARSGAAQEIWEEKADQIRIYSGGSFRMVQEAAAGTVCAVTGLSQTYAGQGLGIEPEAELPLLEPVLSYRVELPPDCDVHQAFLKLRLLEEEEPQLHIVWDEQLAEIHAQLMGEVQTEVLKTIIRERFGILVSFGEGNIVYKETIRNAVVGLGHFEPLRHYAEVHLLLELGERGSGLQFATVCSEDVLDRNWQRLILTHLEEKAHRGVLTGSEITDMRITLLTGRSHLKHTEGGDFRQATYRAVRHGLKCAESILLEPVYEFRLEAPAESVGRALSDIQRMAGSFEPPVTEGDIVVITGRAPVVTMRGYQTELTAYTKGRGRLACTLAGYEECHNAEEVIEARGYDSESDFDNPTGSVFCAHGAGYVVGWEQVKDYVHVENTWKPGDTVIMDEDGSPVWGGMRGRLGSAFANDYADSAYDASAKGYPAGASAYGASAKGYPAGNSVYGVPAKGYPVGNSAYSAPAKGYPTGGSASGGRGGSRGSDTAASEKELEEIFTRTYGPVQRERNRFLRSHKPENYTPGRARRPQEALEEYLLVDGYNIIFAWDDLKELSKTTMAGARDRLMDILSNYAGYKKNHLILVFDAYKVEGNRGEVQKYHNIHVVYTKEAETADQYIEKTVRTIDRKYHVTVATSDALEQVIILGAGATRMSAAGLREEIDLMNQDLRTNYLERPKSGKAHMFDHRPEVEDELRSSLPEE